MYRVINIFKILVINTFDRNTFPRPFLFHPSISESLPENPNLILRGKGLRKRVREDNKYEISPTFDCNTYVPNICKDLKRSC